jgi:hypothetical protein
MGDYRDPGYGSLAWIEFEITAELPETIEIPLDIRYAYEVFDPPQTYLLYSDGTKKPLDAYNATVVPEFNFLTMLALMGSFSLVIYIHKKKQ